MARTNLSLGNLHRAVSGSVRTSQAVSLGQLNGGGSNINMLGFATDAITVTPPTYTYIVESTTENAQFSFSSTGSQFYNKVQSQTANFTCSFNNANFNASSATKTTGPSVFPINAASIAQSNYSEASATLTMKYQDGYNVNATNYGSVTTKVLYAVDVYNTINEPDFCLLFGTKIELADGTEVNVEDLNVGDQIKSWVPAGLPDETQDAESDQVDWRFHFSTSLEGTAQNVTVKDVTFNFAEGYVSLNDGLIKATETHPLYVWDSEIQKYKFKNIGDIIIGDKLIMEDETEVEVTNIELVREDVEIVTVNVEDADVYIANGLISHNKGTTAQPFIPSSGLRMYLDPSKAASTNGTATTDWLDLSGYNTGMRPAGVSNAAGISGKANPAYNAGGTRKEKYWQGATDAFWYKDGTTNINGGYTQFNASEYTVVTWVRFASHPANGYYSFFNKQNTSGTANRLISLYLNSNGSGTYFIHDGTPIQFNSNTFTLNTNTWYMISYTAKADGTNVAYTDTTSRGTVSNGSQTYTTSGLIQIGGNYIENGYYFNGQIGPVLFYNRQLSGTEITQIYDYFSPTYK
jgi:hypothetical protein